jgi:hypothetical protein
VNEENKGAVKQVTTAPLSSRWILLQFISARDNMLVSAELSFERRSPRKGDEMNSIVGEFYGFKLRTPEESDRTTLE